MQPPSVTIGVYNEAECITELSSINWGDLEPGASKNVTVYVKNLGTRASTLYLSTQNWSPSEAQNYLTVGWDYDGTPLQPDDVIPIQLIISVSTEITDIATFNFEIVIISEG